ncbi:peptidylprolyl isomerase [Candidatus Pacearchaeota archaeon]|nr:peptidylprolyl isomerase [Candidatus Pacearchaeota archaeon]
MLQKNDFIELEFTGKVKNGEIFDTNIKEEAKKINLEIDTRPLIICLGQNMILPAIDEFLIGKEVGKYTLELEPEKAFGSRNREMIKTMPLKIFLEKETYPHPGMVFNFDNIMGRISAVSGGRVIVDFNHPLANKTVVYELNVKRKSEDNKEKVECLQIFFFRRKFDFEIKENKLIIKAEEKIKPLFEIFKSKFKEILNLELEVEILPEKAEENPEK